MGKSMRLPRTGRTDEEIVLDYANAIESVDPTSVVVRVLRDMVRRGGEDHARIKELEEALRKIQYLGTGSDPHGEQASRIHEISSAALAGKEAKDG
jgi:hypothetical protein